MYPDPAYVAPSPVACAELIFCYIKYDLTLTEASALIRAFMTERVKFFFPLSHSEGVSMLCYGH